MTLTLEITPEIEATLQCVAASHGQSLSDYAAELLAQAAQNANDLDEAMRAGADIMAPLYAESLATGGELTAASNNNQDIHEYGAEELAAMEAGEFEQPLRRAA